MNRKPAMGIEPATLRQLHRRLDQVEANTAVMTFLVFALFDQAEDKVAIIRHVRELLAFLVEVAPEGTDKSLLKAVKARGRRLVAELSASARRAA